MAPPEPGTVFMTQAWSADLGLGEVFGDAFDVGAAHVDAHLLDVRGVAVMGLEIVGELANRIGATALGDEQHAALIDVSPSTSSPTTVPMEEAR